MARHAAITPGTPTQVAHPWRAAARTVAAYVVLLVPVLPAIIGLVNEHFAPYLPDSWELTLAAVATFIRVLLGLITRLMALPNLQPVLEKLRLGTGVEKEVQPRPLYRQDELDV